MTNPLPIIYLHASGPQGISGSIRFQKLIFLGQKETNLPEKYRFIPYEFGPYSYQLDRNIENWRERGHIQRNRNYNEAGNLRVDYSLSPDGLRLARELNSRDKYAVLFEEANKITSEYGNKKLSNLLKYVYTKYPDYTDESTLDIKRLFDESMTSQFAEPNESQVGPFNQIKKLNEENGEVLGTDQEFVRQYLEIGSEFHATLEKIRSDSLSIYWRTNAPSLSKFIQAVRIDENISDSAASEMYISEHPEWISGELNELLEKAESEECLFLRIKSDDGRYTVTWESEIEDGEDEVTIYMEVKNAEYEDLRSALVGYVTATVLSDQSDLNPRKRTPDDLLRESFRQAAKLAIS